MQILDCTIRDGGYYTNWDFEILLVDTYLTAANSAAALVVQHRI